MSDMKNRGDHLQPQHSNPSGWEEWQLTAYVLDELEADVAEQITAAAKNDAQLASEIAAIQQATRQIRRLFDSEPQSGLRPEQAAHIVQSSGPLSGSDAQPSASRPTWTGRRLAMGLVATAACLLLIFTLAAPQFGDWMVASRTTTSPSRPLPTDNPLQPAAAGMRQSSLSDETVKSPNTNRFFGELAGEEAKPTVDHEQSTAADHPFQVEGLEARTLPAIPPTGPQPAITPQPAPGAPSGAGGMMGGGGYGSGYGGGMPSEAGLGARGVGGYGYAGDNQAGGYGDFGSYGGMGMGMEPGTPADAYYAEPAPTYGRSSGAAAGAPTQPMPESAPAGEHFGAQPASTLPADHLSSALEGAASGGYRGEALARLGGPGGGAPLSGQQPAWELAEVEAEVARASQLLGNNHPDVRQLREHVDQVRRKLTRLPRLGRPAGTGDQFESIIENDFLAVENEPLSTFSIDVDSASYTKCRQLLLEYGRLPPPAAVRIEEFVNYFDYEYAGPQKDAPFAADLAVASCPWQPQHKLLRIGLQATKLELADRPPANIVFLLDVSGSMNEPNKLPLVKESMRMLARQLGENDRVAMAVYAGAAGCVLGGTRGDQQATILGAIEQLSAGGSTNGGQGIALAYQLARDNFIPEGINRVILCTDGDFNVGMTSTDALVDLVAENAKSKIFLTVMGFGMGNTNDAMLERISNRGNGIYSFVDSHREAHRQMVEQLAGNLMTVAKDVKIQVEFNPSKVKAYRLIGYENRLLATEDFNDDRKDAGEIGAGHRVTALYEMVPVGIEGPASKPSVDDLRYRAAAVEQVEAEELPLDTPAEFSDELLAVKLRYKQPEGDTSQLLTFPLLDQSRSFAEADLNFRWAASVAEFAMLLRGSRYAGQATWASLLAQAEAAAGVSPTADQQECLEMIRAAASKH